MINNANVFTAFGLALYITYVFINLKKLQDF